MLRWEHGSETFRPLSRLLQTDRPTIQQTIQQSIQPTDGDTGLGFPIVNKIVSKLLRLLEFGKQLFTLSHFLFTLLFTFFGSLSPQVISFHSPIS